MPLQSPHLGEPPHQCLIRVLLKSKVPFPLLNCLVSTLRMLKDCIWLLMYGFYVGNTNGRCGDTGGYDVEEVPFDSPRGRRSVTSTRSNMASWVSEALPQWSLGGVGAFLAIQSMINVTSIRNIHSILLLTAKYKFISASPFYTKSGSFLFATHPVKSKMS